MTLDQIFKLLNDERLCPVVYQKHLRYRITSYYHAYMAFSEDEFKGILPYLVANEVIRDHEINHSKAQLYHFLQTASLTKLEENTPIKKYFDNSLNEKNRIKDYNESKNT